MKASVVTALLYTGACKIIFLSEDNLGSKYSKVLQKFVDKGSNLSNDQTQDLMC